MREHVWLFLLLLLLLEFLVRSYVCESVLRSAGVAKCGQSKITKIHMYVQHIHSYICNICMCCCVYVLFIHCKVLLWVEIFCEFLSHLLLFAPRSVQEPPAYILIGLLIACRQFNGYLN